MKKKTTNNNDNDDDEKHLFCFTEQFQHTLFCHHFFFLSPAIGGIPEIFSSKNSSSLKPDLTQESHLLLMIAVKL